MAEPKFKIESGVQLFARLARKSDIEKFYPILFSSGPKQGEVIEFSVNNHSPLILLTDIICEALISNNTDSTGTGVLIFKTDGKLNDEELINILRQKIISRIDKNCNIELDDMYHKILKEIFVVDIYDSTQFYTTIHNLDNILLEHRNISIVVFDTITAFYWSEQGFKITKMDLYIKNLLRIIQNVTKQYNVVCIYTRPDHFYSTNIVDTNELPITDGVDYRVQILDRNDTETYQVNIKTRDQCFKKYFHIIDNEIKWL